MCSTHAKNHSCLFLNSCTPVLNSRRASSTTHLKTNNKEGVITQEVHLHGRKRREFTNNRAIHTAQLLETMAAFGISDAQKL